MKIMFISDVRNFKTAKTLFEALRPDCIVMLGDLLFDGPGQVYVLDEEEIPPDVERSTLVREATVKMDDLIFIRGNTHTSRELFKIHLFYFKRFLSVVENAGINYYIIPGNHDEFLNYADILQHLGFSRFRFFERPAKIVCDEEIYLLPYGAKPDRSACASARIIGAHESQRKVKTLLECAAPCSGVISGHYGHLIERHQNESGEKILLRIDDFPFSFATYENGIYRLYEGDISVLVDEDASLRKYSVKQERLC